VNGINSVRIRTPEGVIFTLLPAGPVARFLAWAIDSALVFVLSAGAGKALSLLSLVSPDAAQGVSLLAFFMLSLGYPMVCEWRFKGQTVGKNLFSLRVVDIQGLRLTPSQIVIRNLLRFIDTLPVCYLVGGIACVITRKAQRLGDIAANTIVVRDRKTGTPDLEQLAPPKYNSLRSHRQLIQRLRHRATPQQAEIALEAILRRDELEPRARLQVFSEIAGVFKGMVSLPPEVTEGVTDEQFVRNVVEVLYR
jgi:uncharacterized RDD family membrane protein YckC